MRTKGKNLLLLFRHCTINDKSKYNVKKVKDMIKQRSENRQEIMLEIIATIACKAVVARL